MSRIILKDTTMKVVAKMSEGNPGAMTALIEIIKKGKSIDPDDFMEGVSSILMLDTCEIYGYAIYVLHSDICDRDTKKMIAVIRAVQLGFLPKEELKKACYREDRKGKEMIPVDELYLKVKERLPNFQ